MRYVLNSLSLSTTHYHRKEAERSNCSPSSDSFIEFKKEETEQSIPDRFEKIVRSYPQCLAVKTKTEAFTYDELNGMANRIARAILAQTGEGNEPIAILLEKGAAVIAAIFGVLKAGKI